MRSGSKFLALMGMGLFLGAASHGATVSGTVKGPTGVPFKGAFVEAQNTKTRMTFIALSDKAGRYHIEQLPGGTYDVRIKATGYDSVSKEDVNLSASRKTSFDFALQKSPVRWNELSIYQAKMLWPESKAKDTIFDKCFVCHGFQTRMASVRRDEDGWKDRVKYMRDSMHFSLAGVFSDRDAADVADYLNSLFGPKPVLPKSPENSPKYKETLRPVSDEAMSIEYVEYEMPGPSRMPFSAVPLKDGSVWIPDFGAANKISKLDPKTGEIKDFSVPNQGTAAVHSVFPAPDGSMWLTEQGSNKLGRWDPVTQKISEYQDAYLPGKEGTQTGGSRHTLRVDEKGVVWSSGYPLTRFDPKTGQFHDFKEAPHTYSVEIDKQGSVWFTNPGTGEIGRIDPETLKVTQWMPPTRDSYERRIMTDTDGTVWFGEFQAGKIGRFDPKSQTFREYDLPGGSLVFPYALGIAADHSVWYSSYYMDVIGRLDPKTGKVIEYPFPHSENTIREFFLDPDGKRMWYGTPSNNKVGYFCVTRASAN